MFEEFVKNIEDALSDFYGDDATVTTHDVLKNNGMHMTGINISFVGENKNIVPVIYLDDIYEKYTSGMEFDECVSEIISIREQYEPVDGDETTKFANAIVDIEYVKSRIYPMLINYEMNKELLDTLVYKPFLDLAIIYQIRGIVTGDGFGSVKVSNALLEQYGIDIETLDEWAMENLKNSGYEFRDIHCVIAEMMDISDADFANDGTLEGKMFVLSNNKKLWGASALLDEDYLKEKLGNRTHYILPSSIHEIIIIPAAEEIFTNELTEMVREVNASQVEAVERLADHIYMYDGETQSVKLCA